MSPIKAYFLVRNLSYIAKMFNCSGGPQTKLLLRLFLLAVLAEASKTILHLVETLEAS